MPPPAAAAGGQPRNGARAAGAQAAVGRPFIAALPCRRAALCCLQALRLVAGAPPLARLALAAGGAPAHLPSALLTAARPRGPLQVSHLTVQTFCISAEALGAVPAADAAALKHEYLDG